MAIPADDKSRQLAMAKPDEDSTLLHLGLVGDTYTLLLTGHQTAGRYCLIDMHVPPGGGPPPHRHDFEETFTVLEGEIEMTFRNQKSILKAGQAANVPANAPHQFQNKSDHAVRLLCTCTPAGQEDFFLEVGEKLPTRTSPPTKLNEKQMAAFRAKSIALAPKYHTELLNSDQI